jgi:beta-aspartyl-peptidase (threonine type)
MRTKIALAVHGGAWDIPDELVEACRAGVQQALERGWAVLEKGGTALDACEQATVELENVPVFDAGVGSHLNRDGRVQLDAIVMDGATLKSGAVAAVERLRNPVRVARLVLERSDHMLLVGAGAEQFAVEHGLSLCNPSELVIARETERWYQERATGQSPPAPPSAGLAEGGSGATGTVGAVALDAHGNLAASTSTGGTAGKFPGRVGDSPLVGCGGYADNRSGAVSATGAGEAIMKVVLSKAACDLLACGADPQAAAEKAVALLRERTEGRGGLLIVDRKARVGAAFSTARMAYAFRTSNSDAVIRV